VGIANVSFDRRLVRAPLQVLHRVRVAVKGHLIHHPRPLVLLPEVDVLGAITGDEVARGGGGPVDSEALLRVSWDKISL
jgi:hypothetical protein